MSSTSPKYTTKQNESLQQNNGNNEVCAVKRERDRCLFCCTPKVLMIVSVIYLILGGIHVITRLAYINECHVLYEKLNSAVPSNMTYDSSAIPTLNVNTMYYYNSYDELWISQLDDASITNTTIRVRTVTKSSNGGQFETSITPFSFNIHLLGRTAIDSFMSIWTVSCVVNRVEVILPRQKDETISLPVNINSNGLDVKFQQNSVPYSYPINIKTISDDVNVENVLVTSASIQSTSGDIKGSISLQDEINIGSTSGDIKISANTNMANGNPKVGLKSTSGDIKLEFDVPNVVVRPTVDISATSGDIKTDVKLVNGITDSQITIKATSGDIDLKLHDSFQGQYQITTTSGDVSVKTDNVINNNRQGKIGSIDSQGFINIKATSGDVEVEF